jgi:hypothetical protein
VSIWATTLSFDADDHEHTCDRWVLCVCGDTHNHPMVMIGDEKRWYYDDSRPCTCFAGPLHYKGSNIVPSDGGPRTGCLHMAEIPSHITADYRHDGPDDGAPLPWLRIGIDEATKVLARAQVGELWRTLGDWLERTKEDR